MAIRGTNKKSLYILLILVIVVVGAAGYTIITKSPPREIKVFSPPSSAINEKKDETTVFSGILKTITRPDPDIPYDYRLELSKPYFDELNSQGPRYINNIIVVPGNDLVKQKLKENINQEITLEGKIEWGLAETRHFKVLSVVD